MRPPTLGGQLRAPRAVGITVCKMTLHHPQGKNESTCVTVLLCHSPKQHFCLWPLCLDPHTASLLISCFYLYQNYFPLKNYSYLLSGSPLLILKKSFSSSTKPHKNAVICLEIVIINSFIIHIIMCHGTHIFLSHAKVLI